MVGDAVLDSLIKEFVNFFGKMTDIGLDVFLDPPLWFAPIENNSARREAANYFLLAASLCDSEVAGNSRNIRVLLDDFHDVFGARLYKITDPAVFEVETQKCETSFQFFDQMGPRKSEIPRIIADFNSFVQKKANGDLIEYTKKLILAGRKPVDFVDELCSVCSVDNQHKGKFWIYLRWMVRNRPDLGLFDFKPQDLIVPLTSPTLSLMEARGLLRKDISGFLVSNEKVNMLWADSKETQVIQKVLNDYAKSLFPEDPAKVDFPFFFLGRWLTGFSLDKEFLEKTLRFLLERYHKIGTWPIRYLVERRHLSKFSCDFNIGAQSPLELPVADFLLKKGIRFEFEPLQFWWAKEHGIVAINPPYTPDFLLSLKYGEKKVLLEPHGVWDELEDYVGKLRVFRKNYGQFFYLILIVPQNFISTILKADPNQESFDQMWSIKEYQGKMQQLCSLCTLF
jgi:hypothetical protein